MNESTKLQKLTKTIETKINELSLESVFNNVPDYILAEHAVRELMNFATTKLMIDKYENR